MAHSKSKAISSSHEISPIDHFANSGIDQTRIEDINDSSQLKKYAIGNQPTVAKS